MIRGLAGATIWSEDVATLKDPEGNLIQLLQRIK